MKPDVYYTPVMKKPRIPPKPQTCQGLAVKDPVSVFCRIRPPDDPAEEVFAVPVNSRTVKLTPPVSSFAFRNGTAKEQLFRFKHVFPADSSQKDVFSTAAKPLIIDLLGGKNGLLFVYGITGSGKTYTMTGSRHDGGVLRRAIDIIFNSINDFQAMKYIFKPDKMNGFDAQSEADALLDRQRLDLLPALYKSNKKMFRKEQTNSQDSSGRIPDTSRIIGIDEDNAYSVFVSYIEIYNNYIYDLLEEFSGNNMVRDLQSKILREDAGHNMYVHGCTEVEIKTPEEAFEVLVKGQKRRKVALTRLNCESSRSHSVFTIRIVQAPHDAQGEEILTEKSSITVSQLSMVDLAGSERNSRTKATGERIKEAGNINNSLMALRQCIEILRENQLNHSNRKVPYRESKLTHYFKHYFEGEGKVHMVVCVNPKADDYDETLPVMKFAELASEVQIHRPISAFRPDLGLTPGRRRANQVFKEARRRLHDEGFKPKELETVDITPVYSLGPAWPPVRFETEEQFEDVVHKLKAFLQKRIATKEKFCTDLREEELTLRGRLSELENENILVRQERDSLRGLYEDAIKKVKNFEDLLLKAEAANDSLQCKFTDYNTLMDDYRQACDERDMAKSQGQIEKQKMKAKLKVKLEAERDRMVSDMQSKLREQKDQLKSQMYVTQVRALQNLFDEPQSNPAVATPRTHGVKHAKSEMRLNGDGASTHTQTPAPTPTRHKRSLSQGASVGSVWIDHRPDEVVEPGTLMQPAMPRRRSVRRLRSGDLLDDKKATHYCLTTHGKDSSGELETKMYKGDVLPTVGGGAQVVFQDVEILKQRDPLDPHCTKRNSDGSPKIDPKTLQARCAAGIANSFRPSPYLHSAKKPRK